MSSVIVFVLVFVESFLFHNVQFDGIESNNFEFCPTLFTRHYFALVRVQIDVNISITFRASSGRHSFFLPRSLLSEGKTRPRTRESATTL